MICTDCAGVWLRFCFIKQKPQVMVDMHLCIWLGLYVGNAHMASHAWHAPHLAVACCSACMKASSLTRGRFRLMSG
jgi:hypothetical protein